MISPMTDYDLLEATKRDNNKAAVIDALRRIGRPATVMELSNASGIHAVAIGNILDRNKMTLSSGPVGFGPRHKQVREVVTFHRDLLPHEIAAGFKEML